MQKIHLDVPKESQVKNTPEGAVAYGEDDAMKKTMRIIIYSVFGLCIIAGIGTGYLLAKNGSKGITATSQVTSSGGGKTYGSNDLKTFPDNAVGTIEKDGMNNEGTHKLIREGGPSQTACLVSSVLDLDEFVGKKVKVWSKTMDAKSCPWLMDVGRIELQ